MAAAPDPFAHHPELRDKITPAEEAGFYRSFSVESLFGDNPEMAWVAEQMFTDTVREAGRAATMAQHDGGDLWVFGYGSLMWNPALHFAEVRRATVPGHARRFTLLDIYGGRGTREAPGLMAALEQGPGCDGLLFRIAAADVDAETEVLWRRECIGPGYTPAFVTALTDDGPLRALTFLADHDTDVIAQGLSFDDQVRLIAQGAGILGSSRDYLASVVDHLALLRINDAEAEALLAAVDARIAQQAERTAP